MSARSSGSRQSAQTLEPSSVAVKCFALTAREMLSSFSSAFGSLLCSRLCTSSVRCECRLTPSWLALRKKACAQRETHGSGTRVQGRRARREALRRARCKGSAAPCCPPSLPQPEAAKIP